MINENNVIQYWHNRSKIYGSKAVGFDAKEDINSSLTEMRKDLFKKFIRLSLPTLDFGCGIGKYSDLFPKYFGVDITDYLLKKAKFYHKDKSFFILNKPYLTDKFRKYFYSVEQVFTSTVLQHCNDDLIIKIFKSFLMLYNLNYINLYEKNNNDTKPHVKSRCTQEYHNLLIDSGFYIKQINSHTHTIHGENHTLSIFKVG